MTLSQSAGPAENAPSASCTRAEMANAIRAPAMDAVQAANPGHPGMPMGMADVATVKNDSGAVFTSGRPVIFQEDK